MKLEEKIERAERYVQWLEKWASASWEEWDKAIHYEEKAAELLAAISLTERGRNTPEQLQLVEEAAEKSIAADAIDEGYDCSKLDSYWNNILTPADFRALQSMEEVVLVEYLGQSRQRCTEGLDWYDVRLKDGGSFSVYVEI